MIALGITAYDPALDADALYRAAMIAQDEENREAFLDYAATMADIRALPEHKTEPLRRLDPQRLPD